ncbi:MAG TPA: hypothetical protein PLP07_07475 [Pyrinomonadaceae bacterium]|nr:hypothetical protein [Chloracidobacterium sp.]MBK9437748.1 hypothetical protein [Chloracidobacterium sp.]MBK9765854.1 hypothetical protein [Chloracidobacterium sp.]HQX55751.1 hypothetical protein [Pyrinomonadaceae bacterium]HQY68153.1 hypothetical protein [Pyrinomonadaceae bacterium]
METTTPRINSVLFAICGLAFVPPCLFFTWYTVRLIWLNLTREDAAAYRSFGMLIGAIAFPLAAIIFGFISWYFINKARNGFRKR